MDYRKIVKQLREKMLLSQEEMAKKLGVSFATVNRWENGHHEPTFKERRKLRDLCKKYHVDFEWGSTWKNGALKEIISVYLFARGKTSKAEITKAKQLIEANDSYHKVTLATGIWKYAYNDEYFAKDNPPDHKKLPNSEHDPYIERIAAAIYLQSGFEE